MCKVQPSKWLARLKSSITACDYQGALAKYSHSPVFASVLLFAVLLVEVWSLVLRANATGFWYDELLTLKISALPSFSDVYSALYAGADGTPPFYYWVVRLARMLPADPHLTIRLPSIVGYLFTLTGIYYFLRRTSAPLIALSAVLLVTLTPFRTYAVEARSYALFIGFLTLAALSWQQIAQKKIAVAFFAIFLALAVSCHYLAVLTIACFGAAELSKTIFLRRIRTTVWISFLAASIPFWLQLPLLVHYRSLFEQHFWAKAKWGDIATSFSNYLGIDGDLALPLVIILGIVALVLYVRSSRCSGENRILPLDPSQGVLMASFALYPVALVIMANVMGSAYVYRYGWPAIIGLAIGFASICPLKYPTVTYVTVALFVASVRQGFHDFRDSFTLAEYAKACSSSWSLVERYSSSNGDLPIVLAGMLDYQEAFDSAPERVHQRFIRVLAEEQAFKLFGFDTQDKTDRIMANFVPMQVQDINTFEKSHKRFIVISGKNVSWLMPYLMGHNYRITLLAQNIPLLRRSPPETVFKVER